MKKIPSILILCTLLFPLPDNIRAQSSIIAYSPSSSLLNGSASRIGYHFNEYFTFYMRYNDSSFFCSELDAALMAMTPGAYKMPLPNDFIITDFKKFKSCQGYIGLYQGVGMYGWGSYGPTPSYSHTLHIFKLPVVDRLKRVASLRTEYTSKAFAIGEKNLGPKQSYIMEFYAEGINEFTPYFYAPMPFDVFTNEQEIADDVTTLSHYVVFATRDTRKNHIPINLRISDTTSVLLHSDIDLQWQFPLPSYMSVLGELRLLSLDEKHFVLMYVVIDTQSSAYFLRMHRINLTDFLVGNNTIVSHEIPVDKSCSDLIDAIYDPEVQTMVILMNGYGESELYHTYPFSNTNSSVSKLIYPDGNFYSIDTIGDIFHMAPDMYVAMGDSVVFCQDISNGIDLIESCLEIEKEDSFLRESPRIGILNDPLARYSDNKILYHIDSEASLFLGSVICPGYVPDH
jgi:hypothetical protein